MNERFLVLKAKNGNQEALEELIKLNYQSIYKYFVRTCGNSATALDLTQDTFIKLVQALPNYQPYKDFCAYLYTIAYHVGIDYLKKKKEILLENEYPFEMQAAPTHEKDENYYRMRKVLYKIPEKQRECLILHYYQGLNYRQISTILSIPISTAKTRVRIGLQRCRDLWEETK